MKALVTGGRGFVGPHLIEHLEAQGDSVRSVDRSDGTDLLDLAAITAAMEADPPEVVYHLAGFSDVGESWDRPVEALRANAEGTLNTLLAARRCGAHRVLVVSSADVYGRVEATDLPLSEDQPLAPISPYGASKVAAEHLAIQAWLGHGLETVRVRSFNHIGPGQTSRFVAAAIAERIALNEADGSDEVPVGNVTPRRDFTDVRDVVRAYRAAMVEGEPGEVYHVCSGRDLSIAQLADQLIAHATRPMHLAPDPELQRPVDNPVSVGDATKLGTATGWSPQIPIDRTLHDLLADARQRVSTH